MNIDLNKFQLIEYSNYRDFVNSKGVNSYHYWQLQKDNSNIYNEMNYNDSKNYLKNTLIKAVNPKQFQMFQLGPFFQVA